MEPLLNPRQIVGERRKNRGSRCHLVVYIAGPDRQLPLCETLHDESSW